MKKLISLLFASLALSTTMIAGVAQASQLTYATGFPPGSVGAVAAEAYAETVAKYSNNDLNLKVFPLSLLNFQETSSGIKSGMADSGVILLPYFQRQFAHSNLIGDQAMLLELEDNLSGLESSAAYAGAMSEFIFQNCPECLNEFLKEGQVFAGQAASSPYYLLCAKPVRDQDALAGARLRIGSGQWSRWASAMGAKSVSISANETYAGLDQGVVDCTVSALTDLSTFNLNEVVTDITLGEPGGVGAGITTNNINAKKWQSLPAKHRETLLRAASVLSAEFVWIYAQKAKDALDAARENNDITIHEPTAELEATTKEFIKQDLQAVTAMYHNEYGVQRGEEMVSTFRSVLNRWLALVEDVESREELANLYWREVFSKVDVDTYGM